MKTILAFLFFIITFVANATEKSPVSGAWQSKDASGNTITMICSDNYLMYAVYDLSQKKYVRSGGGTYQLADLGGKKVLSFKRDFNTEDSTVVGLTVANLYTLNNSELTLTEGPLAGNWKKVDDSKSSKNMANVWQIKAREGADFKMQTI
jgi:hypothetical protein